MNPNMKELAATVALFITLLLGAMEPMMNNKIPEQAKTRLKPAEIREAIQAEYDNAARVMAETDRLDESTRIQFVQNCAERVRRISTDPIAVFCRKTQGERRRIMWALHDLMEGERYSGGTA